MTPRKPAKPAPAPDEKGGRAGIGERLAIAVALHFGDPMPARFLGPDGELNPAWWSYERGQTTHHPREYTGPRGSANHKLVAALLDLLTKRHQPGPVDWRDPRAWLAVWYAVMRDEGHDGYELLSTIYGGAHSIVAMICADLGIPGAAEHVQRQVALYSLHLTGEKRLVMPGCRSKRDEDPALELWARYMLGEDRPTRRIVGPRGRERVVRGGMEIDVARRLKARRWILPQWANDGFYLATVRSAVGTLVHRQHERGFVSYFETGPRAHAWPIAAVVAVDGAEPVWVRVPTSKQGKGAGHVLSTVAINPTGEVLLVDTMEWGQTVDLAPLGPLVREVRIGNDKEEQR